MKTKLLLATEVFAMQDNFARRFLISKQLQLVLPPIPLQEHFVLPVNPAIHFVATDGIIKGPDSQDWTLKSVNGKSSIQTVTELTRMEGNPTKTSFNVQNEMDAWLRKHREFRKTRDVETDDPGTQKAVIYNYAMLPQIYRYGRNRFTEYNRWLNTWGTVVDRVASSASGRTHLLFAQLPKRLPSMRRMKELLTRNMTELSNALTDPDARFFFEVWKWIDPVTRERSIFAPLSPEQMSKTTIIFSDAGRTMGFNLGSVNAWIENPAATEKQRNVLPATRVQMSIIRGIIGLMQQRPDSAGVMDEDIPGEDADGTVRVLTVEDDLPPPENIKDEESFNQRAQAIVDKLDEDIAAHDMIEAQTELVTETAEEQALSITERGNKASVNSFDQVGSLKVEDHLQDALEEASERGALTTPEYMKLSRFMSAAEALPSPYGTEETAREYAKVEPASTEIRDVRTTPDDKVLVDKSMRSKVFESLDGDYIRNTLNRDKVAMVQGIQRAGFILTAHSVSRVEDINNVFESHDIKYQPIEGASSPIRFKSPIISEEGIISNNGSNYRFRRQRVDLPIRKINDYQVALSSYYPNKTFVSRSEGSAYNYNTWLQKKISLLIVQKGSPISKVHTGDCFVHEIPAPRAFTALAKVWRDMVFGEVQLLLNLAHQETDFGQEAVEFAKQQKLTLFGKGLGSKSGVIYAMDENSNVYTMKDGDIQLVSNFEAFVGLDETTKPVEFTSCRIFGKEVPTGVVLGYYYGLSGLIKMLGAQVRQVPAGTRANVGPGEWSLVFEDFTLVFSQDDRVASLVLSGLNQAAKAIKRFSMFHFDQPAVYFSVLEALGLNGRYMRELDSLRDLFVDDITARVLTKMGEPTTYPQLIHRATEMLLDEKYKRPLDPTEMRYRGAERIAGAIYTQLVLAVREQRSKISRSTAKIELKPYSIHKHVMTDASLMIVKDINPVHNLKEITAMTYTGHGGRSARAMTRRMRGLDVNDQGTLGDATVDSSQVGYNAYMSMAPRMANTEGMILPPTGPNSPTSSLLSPAALASPAINSDDGKRIGMASIQHSHTIACDGYVRSPVMTGFERVIAHHTDSSFARSAKMKGTIKSKNAYGIVVEYEDGTTEAMPTGRRFGEAAGMTLPHDMVTQYEVGESFDQGAVLVFHKGFFAPVPFKKGVVDWMNGTIARFAFQDTRETHEDASSISADFAKRISTRVTAKRDIIVEFNKEVYNLVEKGQEINYSDSLCVVADAQAAQTSMFSEDRLNTLKLISGDSNVAHVSGVVDDVEVFYHGMVEDMSPTLRAIVERTDRQVARRRKAAGLSVVTASTDDSMTIGGEPLLMNTAYIRIRITHEVNGGIGNKGVICHQLKTETSKVYAKRTTLDDGLPIDGFYGSKSLFARTVYSAFKVGTALTNSGLASVAMAKIYKGIKK